jgi:hypothetical protein
VGERKKREDGTKGVKEKKVEGRRYTERNIFSNRL